MAQVHPKLKHFSMIRSFHFADLLTIANGCCGIAAVFHAMRYLEQHDQRQLYFAALLIPVAVIFDVLDGRIARWRHTHSPMGRELDSLADVISFGVAPAAIAFAAGVNTGLDQVALMYFAVCGLSRLARYNVTAEALATPSGKVRYFEGTPIPSSVVPLALLMIAFHAGNLFPVQLLHLPGHAIVLLFLLSGSLMISKTIRIPKP
ncbi:MAG TPA: CDP-diacylglycerol--serine O-phosphatidyltransferase [Candidatus Margulisiibacteriota bacterium]|nr:CDP-diacylglycerol--serine O-phosphatidyltransferase [Candidatus Margulisiibacteriota bacterium]